MKKLIIIFIVLLAGCSKPDMRPVWLAQVETEFCWVFYSDTAVAVTDHQKFVLGNNADVEFIVSGKVPINVTIYRGIDIVVSKQVDAFKTDTTNIYTY